MTDNVNQSQKEKENVAESMVENDAVLETKIQPGQVIKLEDLKKLMEEAEPKDPELLRLYEKSFEKIKVMQLLS